MLHITYIILCISYKSGFPKSRYSFCPAWFVHKKNWFKPIQTGSKYSSIFNIPNLQYHYTILYVIPALLKIRNCTLACSSTNSARSRVCVSRVHAGSDLVNRKHHSVESTKFILLVQIYIFCSSSKSALWRH